MKLPLSVGELWIIIVIILFPMILYINTIKNDYALDDSIVITENAFVQKGIEGIAEIFTNESFTGFFKTKKDLVQGGRYRPLSQVTFALETEFFGNRPGLSHLINTLIYSLICLLLYFFLKQLLKYFGISEYVKETAFIAALLYAVHPVHTEVVANIKGRDELFVVLFGILTLLTFLKFAKTGSVWILVISVSALFLGLLSKENSIAVVPVCFVLFLQKDSNIKNGRYLAGIVGLLLVTGMYIIIRFKVLGGFFSSESNELMNNPFLHAAKNQKLPTIFYTLLLYLKLLVFPHPLTYDYYPYHISLQNWNPLTVLSLIIHIAMIVFAALNLRSKRAVSFAILFYCITLYPVSNLSISVGTFMNERFLFLSSIGFTLIVAYILVNIILKSETGVTPINTILIGFSLILLMFSIKTVTRNKHWRNNFTLFTHDVKISENSAKGNVAAGGILYETALEEKDENIKGRYLKLSQKYLERSLKIYPEYIDALLLAGNVSYHLKKYSDVLDYYGKIFNLNPFYELAYGNLIKMLGSIKNPVMRIRGYELILKHKPENFDAIHQLGVTYGKMLKRPEKAILYLEAAIRQQPDNKEVNRDLGVAYAMTGNHQGSLPYFQRVVELDPDDPDNYINLGITYRYLGNNIKAREMFRKAEELKNQN
ncbi:MAG: tetratricopeptide repeat protein [Bacteroidales bacterium]|nr:tetratricopeptide repeat protein [Bacteroidales bacterium]